MPKKKAVLPPSLLVELNVRGTPWIDSGQNVRCNDFAAFLRTNDLAPTIRCDTFGREEIVSNWARFARDLDRPLEYISLVSSSGTSKQLDLLLIELVGKATPTCSLLIDGFRISGEQFRRLTAQFEYLAFARCHFARGWWLSEPNRKCHTLTLESCTGVRQVMNTVGGASWSALKYLGVHGPGRALDLQRLGRWPEYPANRELTEPFARELVAALWGESLEGVSLDNLVSIDFLASLPSRKSIRSICLYSPVTPSVLEWVAGNLSLETLVMAWRPGTRLPWSELRRLKGLKSLDVSDSPFDDEDLKSLVQFSKLRTLVAYYSNLTPASWPVVLSLPSLRSFWVSMEMSGDEEPEGLPESTQLRKFVALNARTEWFERLFSRYPHVKLGNM